MVGMDNKKDPSAKESPLVKKPCLQMDKDNDVSPGA